MKKNGINLDAIFYRAAKAFSFLVLIIALLLFYELFAGSKLSLKSGANFIFSTAWNPVKNEFGALPFIYGTFLSSTLALLIAFPVSIGIAVFLTEIAPKWLREPLSFLVELIAAIPSVIIGLWGIFVLSPLVRGILNYATGEYVPGQSMLTASLVLAIMITPIISAISREALKSVPHEFKEAAYGLGATRYEMIRIAALPYAKRGIAGAVILGYGRAIGETMATTMVIGNTPRISFSLLKPGYTMAAVIANEFAEASGAVYASALIEIGFLLLLISLAINIIGRVFILKEGGRR